MQLNSRKAALLATACLLLSGTATANDISNPTFAVAGSGATLPFADWVEGSDIATSPTGRLDAFAAASSCDALCTTLAVDGTVSGHGAIYQNVTLAPGIYQLGYYLKNTDASANSFRASIGPVETRLITNDGAFGYTRFNDFAAVSGGVTQVAFAMSQDTGSYLLDDVSLVMVDDGAGENLAAAAQAVAFRNTWVFLDRLQARFGHADSPVQVALNAPAEVASNDSVYVSPNGRFRAHLAGYGDRAKWDSGTVKERRWGISGGAEYGLTRAIDVGFSVSAGHSHYSSLSLLTDNRGLGDEYTAAIHAHLSPAGSPLYVTGALGYGYASNDLTRTSVLGLGELIARDVETTQWFASLELGYDWSPLSALTLTPFLRGDGARLDQQGYTEIPVNGSSMLPLTVDAVSQDALRTILGMRGSIDLNVGRRGARLSAGAGWSHEFQRERNATFYYTSIVTAPVTNNVTFADVASAANPKSNSAVASASVEAPISYDARVYVGYSGEFAAGQDIHAGEVGLRINW